MLKQALQNEHERMLAETRRSALLSQIPQVRSAGSGHSLPVQHTASTSIITGSAGGMQRHPLTVSGFEIGQLRLMMHVAGLNAASLSDCTIG